MWWTEERRKDENVLSETNKRNWVRIGQRNEMKATSMILHLYPLLGTTASHKETCMCG